MKTVKILSLFFLFAMAFFSCDMKINLHEQSELEILHNSLHANLASFDFIYDAERDLLYSDCDKYRVVLLVDNICIDDVENYSLVIPYQILYKIGGDILLSDSSIFDLSLPNRSSLLLSFDDCYLNNWLKHLSLFTDNKLKATFFVYGTPSSLKSFAQTIQKSKLEFGYHTLTHKKNLEDFCDEDNLKTEAINPAIELHKNYIYANSFALPNGAYIPYVIDELLKYYKIVRLYDSKFKLYKPEEIGKSRVIHSCAIDNNRFSDDETFEKVLFKRLLISRISESVFPCTSHNIVESLDDVSDSSYTITTSRLFYIIRCLEMLNMKSSLYKDFYYYIY